MSLAHELKRQAPACRLVYVGLKGEKISGLEKRLAVFDEIYRVSSGKFRRYHGRSLWAKMTDLKTLVLNVIDIFKIAAGFWQARRLLKRLRPAAVFSKGGYVVVPVGLAARWHKLPLMTHDSDSRAGLANRLVGRWAALHATGYPPAYYDYPKAKTVYTGIPVDPRLRPVDAKLQAAMKRRLGHKADDKILLVGSAGHGSKSINQLLAAAAPRLFQSVPNLVIYHLAGRQHVEATVGAYRQNLDQARLKKIKVLGFVDDFYVYSAAADLIVTRAGATALAEFAVQGKALVVIPAAWLPGGHQAANARELGSAAKIVDDGIEPADFASLVASLLNDPRSRQQLAARLSAKAKPEAASQIASQLLKLGTGSDRGDG